MRGSLLRNGSPVQRSFAAHEFYRGDDVENLIAKLPPSFLIRHSPYVTIFFMDQKHSESDRDVRVVAKNGQLIHASSAVETGPRKYTHVTFFGDTAYYFDPSYGESLKTGIERFVDERRNAIMAVTGAMSWCR